MFDFPVPIPHFQRYRRKSLLACLQGKAPLPSPVQTLYTPRTPPRSPHTVLRYRTCVRGSHSQESLSGRHCQGEVQGEEQPSFKPGNRNIGGSRRGTA